MVQLHALHAGLEPIRATTDIGLILHIETDRASWRQVSRELEDLGYAVRRSLDAETPVHRFVRGVQIVDVLVADHVAPRAYVRRSAGERLVRAPGGTSALRKTINCHVSVGDSSVAVISVPDALGALTLKGGAFIADTRDRDRHLEDAVLLAATISDARALRADQQAWTKGDPGRIRALHHNLPMTHPAWSLLTPQLRRRGQAALRVLASKRTT